MTINYKVYYCYYELWIVLKYCSHIYERFMYKNIILSITKYSFRHFPSTLSFFVAQLIYVLSHKMAVPLSETMNFNSVVPEFS